MTSPTTNTRSNTAYAVGSIVCCVGTGLTIAGSYYLATTSSMCNQDDAACLRERIAGIAMTSIGVPFLACAGGFLCCFSAMKGCNDASKGCCDDMPWNT